MNVLTFLFLVVIDCLLAVINRLHMARLRLHRVPNLQIHTHEISKEILNNATWKHATMALLSDAAPKPVGDVATFAPGSRLAAEISRAIEKAAAAPQAPSEETIERLAVLMLEDAAQHGPRTWEAFQAHFGVQGWAGSVALIRLVQRGQLWVNQEGIRADPGEVRCAD